MSCSVPHTASLGWVFFYLAKQESRDNHQVLSAFLALAPNTCCTFGDKWVTYKLLDFHSSFKNISSTLQHFHTCSEVVLGISQIETGVELKKNKKTLSYIRTNYSLQPPDIFWCKSHAGASQLVTNASSISLVYLFKTHNTQEQITGTFEKIFSTHNRFLTYNFLENLQVSW